MRSRKPRPAWGEEAAPTKRGRTPATLAPRELTLDEALTAYPGQWVLMRVTRWDDHAYPARGYLVAHSRSRVKIDAAWSEAFLAGQSTPGILYRFQAHAPLRTQQEWTAALERLAEEWAGDPLGLRPDA